MPSLKYYFRRIGELPLPEALRRAGQIAKETTLRAGLPFYDRCFRPSFTPTDLIRKCGFSNASELLFHFKNRTNPAFFIDDAVDYSEVLTEQAPKTRENIVHLAQMAMLHIVDMLGSGPTNLDDFKSQSTGYIPWHVDFKAKAGWSPHTHYTRIPYGHLPGLDIKTPWELSRFQHALPLGQAYKLTGDERYAEEFVAQVSDWIMQNPCRNGVNWASPMEAGLRAVNWIWIFYLVRKSLAINESFLQRFLTSLYEHGQFIIGNLEYVSLWTGGQRRRLNSNHYLSNLLGLLYISMMFPEFGMLSYRDFAIRELQIELFEEVYPDGADYEHSISYHRLVFEIFLSAFFLLKINGHSLSKTTVERFRNMSRFVGDYTRPDGTFPQFGDTDDGRVHPFGDAVQMDHRYLSVLAAELIGETTKEWHCASPETLWWLGKIGRYNPSEKRDSAAHADVGFYTMRGESCHVFISAAEVGMRGFGSHSHNDVLSFEYWWNSHPWIVDPGTYTYTADPKSRNLFRSTAYHNTVQIDGEEINTFSSEALFQMNNNARVSVEQWTTEAARDSLCVSHTGYLRLAKPVLHRRQFQLDKKTNQLTILDSFEGEGSHLCEWFFHLNPSIVTNPDDTVVLKISDDELRLHCTRMDLEAQIVDGWYSPSYGRRTAAKVIRFAKVLDVPFFVTFHIEPVSRTRADASR